MQASTSAIRGVVSKFAETLNQHDIKAFAQLFAEDADFVTIVAGHDKGRDEIERHFSAIMSGMYKDSPLTARSVSVRFLRPDVALVHVGREAPKPVSGQLPV